MPSGGRDQPRPAGPPVLHDVRFSTLAECACGWRARLEHGRYDDADLGRLKAQHETGEPA